jgi:hypothetical protein
MKTVFLLLVTTGLAITAGACSRSDEDIARRQGREAAQTVEKDAKKASREINRDLDKTRDKVREALHDTH